MAKDDFSLEVKYPADRFDVMDDNIIKIVRRQPHSTGIDVGDSNKKPKRSLVFGFATEKARNNAKRRIQKHKFPKLTVQVWDD
jgi:hypothetical protein